MSRPDAFSNHLERWVRRKCTTSIVFVELRPRNVHRVKELWDKCFPIHKPTNPTAEQKEAFAQKQAARLEACEHFQVCTGFVVKEDKGDLWILTCAHVLRFLFSRTFPITKETVNDLYQPMILCDHNELRYQTESGANADAERAYMKARVIQVRRTEDLMLLCVSAQEVQKTCQNQHPALTMARSFPAQLEKVVMLSWPADSHNTAVSGNVAHCCRPTNSFLKRNPHGYRMNLAQVDITSEEGSSGAPLLNGNGDYLATLHGGNGSFSFFTSFDDLRRVLRLWDVIESEDVV